MNNPVTWTNLLGTFQLTNTNTLETLAVSGGAVRDWLLGIPHNDIDIFAVLRQGQTTNEIRVPENWLGGQRPQGEYDNAEIVGVFDYVVNRERVNVIVLRPGTFLEDYVRRFDCPLNKGIFKRITGLSVSQETLTDMERKEIFVEDPNNPQHVGRAQNFLQRVSRVEQGWRIINLPQPTMDDNF